MPCHANSVMVLKKFKIIVVFEPFVAVKPTKVYQIQPQFLKTFVQKVSGSGAKDRGYRVFYINGKQRKNQKTCRLHNINFISSVSKNLDFFFTINNDNKTHGRCDIKFLSY